MVQDMRESESCEGHTEVNQKWLSQFSEFMKLRQRARAIRNAYCETRDWIEWEMRHPGFKALYRFDFLYAQTERMHTL